MLFLHLVGTEQSITDFNGDGVNTHTLKNVVEKATGVVKAPKE